MHEIDTSGHVANQFADADPGGPTAGTIVNDDWLNAVQNEIVNAIEDAGITLVKGTNDQLSDAIRLTITNVAHTFTQLETFSKGVTVTQATSNAVGVTVTGNGTATGILATGGATGPGGRFYGGATSGNGIEAHGTGGGSGVSGTGGPTSGVGVWGDGGASDGTGVKAVGGATNGKGLVATGTGSGNAIEATTTTGYAAYLTGNSTRAPLLLGSLAAAPSATDAGAVYYNSTDGKLYVRNGVAGAWQACN